jgi:hypothetical protein
MATPSSTLTTNRSQAILAEIEKLARSQQTPSQSASPEDRNAAILSEVERAGTQPQSQPSREDLISQEVSRIAGTLPRSKSQAILGEVQDIAARRAQPIISGGSFLERALDVINTPQQMLFGIATREPGESYSQAAVRGAKENIRFADVVEREGGVEGTQTTRMFSFWGDMLFDPLVWLPVGKLTKGIAETLKLGGKAAVGVAETIAPVLSKRLYESAIKPIAHTFSRTALRSAAEKDLIGMVDIEISKAQASANRILIEEADARKIVTTLAKATGRPEDELLREVARRVEVKTGAQIAFPFATERESAKILGAPQLDLFEGVKGEIGREFAVIKDAVNKAAEDFKVIDAMPKEVEREIALQATNMKQRLENSLVREMSFGLKTTRLEDSSVDYLTHLTLPDAKKLLVKLPQFASFGREFNPRHAFQLARILDENHPAIAKAIETGGKADIETLNRLWQEGKLFPQLGPSQATKLFNDDPFVVAAVRRVRGEKAIADAEVLIKASGDRRFALPKGEAPAHFRPVNLPADARFDRLRSYINKFAYDPEIAAHLEKTVETTLLPEGLDKFVKTFDTAQNIWKGITLAPFPAYHLRNAVGNVWNNYLAGLWDVKYYDKALAIQTGKLTHVAFAGRKVPLPVFKNILENFGVTTGTFVEGELLKKGLPGMSSRVYATAEDIPLGIGKLVSFGLKTGKEIENNARIAHFLFKLDKGEDFMGAALSVRKYLFDYSRGLTDFEQTVMRRVFPFYAWTRFNVPLQIQALVSNPRPYVRLSEFVNTMRSVNVEGGTEYQEKAALYRGEDSRFLAEYIKGNVGIPYRLAENGEPEYFLFSSWLPAADLNLLTRPLARLKDLLSPFIKTPIELLTNKDLFRDRDIEEYPGETGRFLGAEVRKRNIQVLKNIRGLATLDRLLKRFDKVEDLSGDQVTVLGVIARELFGLKAYPAEPSIEARKIEKEKRERMKQLKGAVRRGLPSAAEILRGEIAPDEDEE